MEMKPISLCNITVCPQHCKLIVIKQYILLFALIVVFCFLSTPPSYALTIDADSIPNNTALDIRDSEGFTDTENLIDGNLDLTLGSPGDINDKESDHAIFVWSDKSIEVTGNTNITSYVGYGTSWYGIVGSLLMRADSQAIFDGDAAFSLYGQSEKNNSGTMPVPMIGIITEKDAAGTKILSLTKT